MSNLGLRPTALFFCLLAIAASLAAAPAARAQGGDDAGSGWSKKKPPASTPTTAPKSAPKTTTPAPASDKDKLKEEGRKLFGPGTSGAAPTGDAGAKGWAVVLCAFKGEGHEQSAASMLDQIRKEGGLPEAYAAKRNDAIILAVGDFPTPDDERAKSELSRIQNLEIGGGAGSAAGKPYANAMLAPPLDWKMTGSMPQFNLSKAKEIYGDKALYTLQVGVYERGDIRHPKQEDLKEIRAAAEQAAAKLRQEGELAFYFHGPTMSMVTVGAFDTSDFDPQIPGYNSPKLREAKKRNPYNLYNGAGIKVKVKGMKEPQIQSSGLVEIPKK